MKLKRRIEQYNYYHPKFLCEYVDDPKETEDFPLKQIALPMEFPLNVEDKNAILNLMMNFGTRQGELSLAAPQIGISKRLIVFKVPMGRGVIQPFRQSLWINPVYKNITDDTEEDYEVCLSVNMVAPVERFKRINYKAYNTRGKVVQGEAQGVTARVIQHLVDHLDGKLLTNLAPREKFITVQEYKQRRKDAWHGKGWEDCIDEIQQELKELRAYYPKLPGKGKKKKTMPLPKMPRI